MYGTYDTNIRALLLYIRANKTPCGFLRKYNHNTGSTFIYRNKWCDMKTYVTVAQNNNIKCKRVLDELENAYILYTSVLGAKCAHETAVIASGKCVKKYLDNYRELLKQSEAHELYFFLEAKYNKIVNCGNLVKQSIEDYSDIIYLRESNMITTFSSLYSFKSNYDVLKLVERIFIIRVNKAFNKTLANKLCDIYGFYISNIILKFMGQLTIYI